jgi:excinuclease ABC subunit C
MTDLFLGISCLGEAVGQSPLNAQGKFVGFGSSRFTPGWKTAGGSFRLARTRPGCRQLLREHCRFRPGVYGMLDADGELIYIGKAKQLRARLLSYFTGPEQDCKAHRILEHSRTLVWQEMPSEFAALVRELELIRQFRPHFNVQGQPGRFRHNYICLGRSPAPYAFLAPQPPRDALAAFGPVRSRRQAAEALRILNDLFQLRDCPQSQTMWFADDRTLLPDDRAAGCLRFELGTCLAPCAGACTRAQYNERLMALRTFLDGGDNSILEKLERSMREAAAERAFERATTTRDMLQNLQWLRDQIERFRQVRRDYDFVYPLVNRRGRGYWYLVRGGQVMAVQRAPQSAPAVLRVAAAIEQVYQPAAAMKTLPAHEDLDLILLLAGWMRQRPAELSQAMPPAAALERCAALLPELT